MPNSSGPRSPLPKPELTPPTNLTLRVVALWAKWVEAYPIGATRHARGDAYAARGAVLSVTPHRETVTCIVAGSKTDTYQVHLLFRPFTEEQVVLVEALREAGKKPEEILVEHAPKLLPRHFEDVKTKCSCPDWLHPCQHSIASLSVLGSYLATNPMMYFNLRMPLPAAEVPQPNTGTSEDGFPEDFQPDAEQFHGPGRNWARIQEEILEPVQTRHLAKELGTFYALTSRFDPNKTLGATMRRAEEVAFHTLQRLRAPDEEAATAETAATDSGSADSPEIMTAPGLVEDSGDSTIN